MVMRDNGIPKFYSGRKEGFNFLCKRDEKLTSDSTVSAVSIRIEGRYYRRALHSETTFVSSTYQISGDMKTNHSSENAYLYPSHPFLPKQAMKLSSMVFSNTPHTSFGFTLSSTNTCVCTLRSMTLMLINCFQISLGPNVEG
jgi:hypothetical protein